MGTVASAPADFSVFRTLSGSTATLERAATLGEGLAISQWSRSSAKTLGYDMPGHHTLSLYLRGGENPSASAWTRCMAARASSACCPPSITRAGA